MRRCSRPRLPSLVCQGYTFWLAAAAAELVRSAREDLRVAEVYLLWHVHELPSGDDNAKLIGVYASSDDAESARKRVCGQPGFRGSPEGFHIDRYEVGRDNWTEGFVTE